MKGGTVFWKAAHSRTSSAEADPALGDCLTTLFTAQPYPLQYEHLLMDILMEYELRLKVKLSSEIIRALSIKLTNSLIIWWECK